MKYVGVIIDNNTSATDELYTYTCDSDDISVGTHVKLPFGVHNKLTDAYVAELSDQPPCGIKRIKSIDSVCADGHLSRDAIETAVWMRNRCLCRYIEAVKCFLPSSAPAKRKTKDPFEGLECEADSPKLLTDEQSAALAEIGEKIGTAGSEIFLLHGVTGSGKTEVYLQLMQKAIESGKSGIVLVPEISLTPQTVGRFTARFGRESVGVLHSKLTPAQKAAEYKKIEDGKVKLVIGARSAIFAPFKDIGLIIIDEEHETSYKSDQSPKYDAIELAAMRAKKHGAVFVLGSATPSVTDYYRSESGTFKRVELLNRYNMTPLPEIEICDMAKELKRGNRSIFSVSLAEEIDACLERGKQAILFLNKRGYSSYVSCRECGYTIKCPECGISMSYHKSEGVCICHYCGRKVKIPQTCPQCGSHMLGKFGIGTEQLEEKTLELFSGASIARLDIDTISHKGSLERILSDFGKGKTDILIGTQIVAKGLDFENVGVVGIINADVSLNIPDFRSGERCFQLITQAAGRAGRGSERGKVIVQTCSPESGAIVHAAAGDYRGFYESEISQRKLLGYPPFGDIFQLIISDEDQEKAEDSAKRCASWLRKRLGGAGVCSEDCAAVLGPTAGTLRKAEGKYRYQVLIKSHPGQRKEISLIVSELRKKYAAGKNTAQLLTADVNPYSFI